VPTSKLLERLAAREPVDLLGDGDPEWPPEERVDSEEEREVCSECGAPYEVRLGCNPFGCAKVKPPKEDEEDYEAAAEPLTVREQRMSKPFPVGSPFPEWSDSGLWVECAVDCQGEPEESGAWIYAVHGMVDSHLLKLIEEAHRRGPLALSPTIGSLPFLGFRSPRG
jgi:hypothetical protein